VREEAPHKHLVFVLNKVDLVPSKVAVSTLCSIHYLHPPPITPHRSSQGPSSPHGLLLLQLWEIKDDSLARGRYGHWVDWLPSWSLVTRVRVFRLS
jgi:hypothetical protein